MKKFWHETLNHWIHGIRFYIAIAIGLITLQVWWWASVNFAGSNLFAIRLEEIYAWLAVGLLTTAVSIGPVYRLFPTLPGRGLAYDSRRLLGIGAAWFSTLHVGVAYLSLFRFANPLSVPSQYRHSFMIGAIASLILLAMAFTSFNAAMRRLGPWWFRLHRLVYVAVLLTMLHAFTIGSHASRVPVVVALAVAATSLILLHSVAIVKQGKPASNWQLGTIGAMTAAAVIIISFGYGQRNQYQGATTTTIQGDSRVQKY